MNHICLQCGKEFYRKGQGAAKFCSHKCRGLSRIGKPCINKKPRVKKAIPVNERQRQYQARQKAKRLAMPFIPCACGCGELIPPINSMGEPAKCKVGHNSRMSNFAGHRFPKGFKPWNAGTAKPKHKETPKERHERIMRIVQGRRSYKGKNNPFYGKKHPPELIKQIATKNSGIGNHGWRGGVSTLPYGIGFTRRFKRLIRERDGNKCQRCGKTRDQHWRALEIHHIDHDKNNNNRLFGN